MFLKKHSLKKKKESYLYQKYYQNKNKKKQINQTNNNKKYRIIKQMKKICQLPSIWHMQRNKQKLLKMKLGKRSKKEERESSYRRKDKSNKKLN